MSSAATADPARLLDQSLAIERLPQLSLALDKLAASATGRLQIYFSKPTTITLAKIEIGQIFAMLSARERTLAGVVRAIGWEGPILIGVEKACLDLVIQAMLGGDGADADVTERAPSPFDMRVTRVMTDAICVALGAAFEQAAASEFIVERVEPQVDPLMLGKRDGPGVIAIYELQVLGRAARFFLVVPQATLGPVRSQLAREESRVKSDPKWQTDLRSRVETTDVMLSAVIDQRVMTLGEIGALRVGALIELRPNAINNIMLTSDETSLFIGQLGQAEGHYTVRIDDVCGEQPPEPMVDEFIDEGEIT